MRQDAMDHPMDDRLLAFLDGEIAEGDRSQTAAHLHDCTDCARRLDELRSAARRFRVAVERVDVSPPWTEVPGRLQATAVAGEGRDDGSRSTTSRRRILGRSPRTLAAAAVLLIVMTGAAAAIPGSPVRSWAADSFRALIGLFGGSATSVPDAESLPDLQEVAGVAVTPTGGRVTVVITAPAAGLRVHVRLVDEARASVSAGGGRYSLGPGRIEILEAAGEMRIGLPRHTSAAMIEVDGRPVVEKTGAELRLLDAPGVSGPEILLETGG